MCGGNFAIKKMDERIREILRENERRKRGEAFEYDPERGLGCTGERVAVEPKVVTFGKVEYVPVEMTRDAEFKRVRSRASWVRLRSRP